MKIIGRVEAEGGGGGSSFHLLFLAFSYWLVVGEAGVHGDVMVMLSLVMVRLVVGGLDVLLLPPPSPALDSLGSQS